MSDISLHLSFVEPFFFPISIYLSPTQHPPLHHVIMVAPTCKALCSLLRCCSAKLRSLRGSSSRCAAAKASSNLVRA